MDRIHGREKTDDSFHRAYSLVYRSNGMRNAAGGMAAPMTPFQKQCLDIINRLNATEFSDWFNPSEIMATIQVESAFRPRAIRHEPSGVTSYGLMQVLDSTAAGLGLHGAADQMFDPEISIRYGMKVHKADWDYLQRHLHRDPDYEEWSAAYNEGAGNVLKGREDVAYTSVWIKAQEYWAPLVDGAAS